MTTLHASTNGTRRIDRVLIVLFGLTILAWALAMTRGRGHAASNGPEAVAVLTIAATKGHFVIREFMEVREAPRWLRRFTAGWLVGLWALLCAMYLYS